MNNAKQFKGVSEEDTTSDMFTLTQLKCTEKCYGYSQLLDLSLQHGHLSTAAVICLW